MTKFNTEDGLYEPVYEQVTSKEYNTKVEFTGYATNAEKWEKRERGQGDRDSRIEIRLSSNELTSLKQLAKNEGTTVSAWVREKIAMYNASL